MAAHRAGGRHSSKGRPRRSGKRRRRQRERVLGPGWTVICVVMFMIAAALIASSARPDGKIAEFVAQISDQAGSAAGTFLSGITEKLQGSAGSRTGKEGEFSSVEGTMTVTFLDVGQGNAVFVECDGEYMLIDGGDREYSSFVVSYLQNQGVEEIKYLVSSHYDADHINGLIGALHVFSVDTVLDGDYEWDTKTYVSFQEAVEENGCREIHPGVGEIYELGEAEFTVVSPEDYDHSDSNDNSIGLRIVYGDNSFLICGDAGSEVEAWMMENGETIRSDVLMCSHHGSANSTSEAFLAAVDPSAVVISCGADNQYGHPSQRVMELLSEGNYDLYRTDVQGTLTAFCDGSRIVWNVEPSSDYSWRTAD